MDFLIGSGIATFAIYAAARWNPKISEKKKIQHVFRNINYKVKDQEPRLARKDRQDSYTDYIYNVPYGLIDDDRLQPILEKTLIRPVAVMFKGKLIVRVYNNKLPTKINYTFEKITDWKVPIGQSHDGMVYHDFDKLHHMTVAGTSQWGKTSFIKMIVTSLIENHPDDVEFYILDLKGMLSFNRYTGLKQIKSVAGDYKESSKVLAMVEKDIKKTMQHFKKNYIENINETNINKRKFIIIDEAGELMPDTSMSADDKKSAKNCQRIISHIARVSAALGFRLIYGTQYPTAKIMDNQIKANTSAKISFRLQTSVQSRVAIDEAGAESLEVPGRAIYKTVDKHIIQTPFINNAEMWPRLRGYEIDSNKKESPETRKNLIEFG